MPDAKHRLVAIGDSLTQGFMSGAIFATDLSYPALIAREMGLNSSQFRYPTFPVLGGIPVNIERLLRFLEKDFGSDLNALELFGAPFSLRQMMDEIEDYWERGHGRDPRPRDGTFHNLASWGMTVDDAVSLTAGYCLQRCQEPTTDDFINQIPEKSFFRTALTVLNPSQSAALRDSTALGAAKALAADGGIENVIVALGANNALGTVTSLNVCKTDDRVLDDPMKYRDQFTLWQPKHFKHFYRLLVRELEGLGAQRVFLANVPHVTIVPIARGVGTGAGARLPEDLRYFKFYTHFWITDELFDPALHPHLTGAQAQMIDETIDEFNDEIRTVIKEQKEKGLHWYLVDICGLLDRLAFRRYREVESGMQPAGGPYKFPSGWGEALRTGGLPELTTHYLQLANNRIKSGGLFSLDGVHPTTMGYGLLAHEFIQVMRSAEVPFLNTRTGALRPDPIQIDFTDLLQHDTLVRMPPGLLDDAIAILNWLDGWIGLGGILQKIHGGGTGS